MTLPHPNSMVTPRIEGDFTPAASVPLMADVGMIVESAYKEDMGRRLTDNDRRFIVRLAALVGCLLGVIAPFVTMGITIFIMYILPLFQIGITTQRKMLILFDVVWCLLLVFMGVVALYFIHKYIHRRFLAKASESLTDILEIRMAIGVMAGMMVYETGVCLVGGESFSFELAWIACWWAILCGFASIVFHVYEKEDNELVPSDEYQVMV